ncbi:MAG: hypothetical protein RIR62_1609 [Pseudomonadota bacterium]|jgi:hypothetical protein
MTRPAPQRRFPAARLPFARSLPLGEIAGLAVVVVLVLLLA